MSNQEPISPEELRKKSVELVDEIVKKYSKPVIYTSSGILFLLGTFGSIFVTLRKHRQNIDSYKIKFAGKAFLIGTSLCGIVTGLTLFTVQKIFGITTIEQFSKAIHLNFGKPVDDEVAKAEENQIINSFSEQERKELEEMGKFLKNIFDEETVKKLDEIETIEKTLQQQKRQNE